MSQFTPQQWLVVLFLSVAVVFFNTALTRMLYAPNQAPQTQTAR